MGGKRGRIKVGRGGGYGEKSGRVLGGERGGLWVRKRGGVWWVKGEFMVGIGDGVMGG